MFNSEKLFLHPVSAWSLTVSGLANCLAKMLKRASDAAFMHSVFVYTQTYAKLPKTHAERLIIKN